jgi:nucleosome binding factor SPN SPT16 subunit
MANVREVYTRKDLIKQLADVETVDEATLAELDRQLAVVDEMGQYLEPMKKWFTELKGALATKASGTKALAEEDEDGVIDAEFEDKPADSDSEEEEEEEEDEEGDDSEDESEAESDDEPEDDSEEEEGDDSEDDSEEEEEEEEEEDEEDEEEEEEPAPPPKKKEKGKGDRKALIQKMHRQMKADKRAAAGAGKLRRV